MADPKIPEGFIEDFKRRKYEEMLDEYRRHREDYERRRMTAPTQEVAQGGRIGYQDAGSVSQYDLINQLIEK